MTPPSAYQRQDKCVRTTTRGAVIPKRRLNFLTLRVTAGVGIILSFHPDRTSSATNNSRFDHGNYSQTNFDHTRHLENKKAAQKAAFLGRKSELTLGELLATTSLVEANFLTLDFTGVTEIAESRAAQAADQAPARRADTAKRKACNQAATEQTLRGAKRKTFMAECMSA